MDPIPWLREEDARERSNAAVALRFRRGVGPETTCTGNPRSPYVTDPNISALVSTFDADDLPSPPAISSGASRGRPLRRQGGWGVY